MNYKYKNDKNQFKIRFDYQFILSSLIIVIIFILSDILKVIDKIQYSYSPEYIFKEPYRIFTAHFFHGDVNHLLANIFGIIMTRYFLIQLNLKNRFFYLSLILSLIPVQILLVLYIDAILNNSENYFAYGFSGVIYGCLSFILLSATYGKGYFLGSKIGLKKNTNVINSTKLIIMIGILYSLIPGISLTGHVSGLIAGLVLFLI
tara:strand:+ start:932 stop:1543 length:612 start_codon:yes stop_codon:yes gene_type:complete